MKAIVFLLLVIVSCATLAQTDTSRHISTYEKSNYKIKYPSSWALDTSTQMEVEFFLFSPRESDSDNFRENVNLIIQNLNNQKIDLERYAKISEEQIKNLATNGKILDFRKIKVANVERYRMIYQMIQGSFNLKIEQHFFIQDDKAFVLTFTADVAKFDSYKDVAERILNSFMTAKE